MRRSANGAPSNAGRGPAQHPRASCDFVKITFALAALLTGLLNFAVVVLFPLSQLDCNLSQEVQAHSRRLVDRSGPGHGQIHEAWSCLHPVDFGSLRLLPNSELEAAARRTPRWLFFGLSSVHRKQAEYLGITLSHLFDALGESLDTGLVIHLADFDESWVTRTQEWLKNGFEDEVQANRLHVIHAPERLYPAKEQVFQNTKYGDPPLRQWWRAKQNVDYAFLMWYAAGLAEYYMQLEDDVQVTPNFLPTVRRFMKEKLTGDAWVMAAFSKLGFIGKLFDSNRLPKLAEFLFIYHAEAPCDWLVWIFIDAASSQPVTALISQDLEDEYNQKENAKRNPNVKKPKSARTDVLLYYKERPPVFLSSPRSISQKVTVAPSPLESPITLSPSSAGTPNARVFSTMQHWQQYAPGMAIGAVSKRGFWSADTCHPTRMMPPCSADSKFVELIFDAPIKLGMVKLTLGAQDHPQDYIRNGTLEAGFTLKQDQQSCESYVSLTSVTTRQVQWHNTLPHLVKCLRVRLLETQQEWVMLKFDEIQTEAAGAAAVMTTSLPKRFAAAPSPSTAKIALATAAEPLSTTLLPVATPAVVVQSTTEMSISTQRSGETTKSPVDPVDPVVQHGFGISRLSRHTLLHIQATGHEDHQDVFATMMASSVGLMAGLAGWVNVLLCRRISLEGTSLVGQFPCWMGSFLPVLDTLLFSTFKAPELTSVCKQQERKLSSERQVNTLWWSDLPQLEMPKRRLQSEPLRWEHLFTPARHLAAKLQDMVVLGNLHEPKWLTVALRLSCQQKEVRELVKVIQKLVSAAGETQILVLVHLSDETLADRKRLTEELSKSCTTELEAGKLLVLRAPERYYRSGREQYELAVLFSAAAALSEYYIQVEDDIVAQEGFVKMLQDYVTQKINSNTTSWNMISTGREGLHRKLFRSHQLIRFAELLPIFPEVPPDSLLWDYIDVINNMSAPKACYIAFSATKIKRSDVILQYHKAEAIIEHVGDVSSLEGKVQRIHDDYFKKHNLLSTLFDNPAADIYPGGTIDPSTSTQLQALYGVHGNGPTMGGAPAVSLAVPAMAELVGKAVLEVVFRKPVAVQMLNLRMGGFLRPAAKNKKQPELADPDFDFVFSNAELSFGRAKTGEALAAANSAVGLRGRAGPSLPGKGFCNIYEPLMNFSGREVFWRSPTSRPAANVECIKVTLWEAPKTTVIVRTIRVRSAKPQRRLGETSEMMHHPGDATASMKLQPSRHWQVEMKSWAKMVTIAFAAGALAGTLGLALTTIPWIHPKARRRTKISQS